MKAITIAILFFTAFDSFSQDTVLIKQQKGFLLLSKYTYSENDQYSGEIKDLGFDDFFFPTKYFSEKLFADSNLCVSFKNGRRIERLNSREKIKKEASKFFCFDSSQCYKNDFFYVIPVIIEGKEYNYNFENCRRNYYELQVIKGAFLRFEYLHKAIKPVKITPLIETRK